MLELGAIAFIVAGGAYALSLVRRGRAHARWSSLLKEAAKGLEGRASPATMFDAPELRATVRDVVVTLKLKRIHLGQRGLTIAEVALDKSAENLRLYIGWDVLAEPKGLEHVPLVAHPRTSVLEGNFIVRATDEAAAHRVLEGATIELLDIRREARARALEIICRGGHLELVLYGTRESSAMLERIALFSRRLRDHLTPPPERSGSPSGSAAEPPIDVDSRMRSDGG